MIKLILPIILSPLIILIALFIFVSPAQAINLNGEWVSQEGAKEKLSQSGDTFSLIVTDSRLEEFIGATSVKGTITGDTFIGQVYYLADKCPNLNGFVPARGTISEGKIEIKYTGFEYDPDRCVKYPNSELEHSNFYTRITTPSPTPTEKPQILPQSEQSNPTVESAKALNDWINDTFNELDIERIETGIQPARVPAINQQEQEAFDKAAPSQASYSVGIINTEGNNHGLIKYPGSQEFTDIKMGDIPPGSIIKSRDDQIVIFTGTGKGGIIVVESDSEFTVPQSGPLDLFQGTMEVKEEKPLQQPVQPYDVSTEFVDIFVIGTHYWVTHEPGKQTTVGVYEGEVKVKTKDDKTALITPSGNKPGVVIVSQKLSTVKLLIAGAVAVIIIGGVIFFLKKRGKGVSTRRK